VVAFVAFSSNRVFAFGTYAACLANIFGFSNFGKLIGLVQFSGGVFGTFAQYFLIYLVDYHLNGQYFFVNLAFFLVGLAIFIGVPLYFTLFMFSGYFFKQNLRVGGFDLEEKEFDSEDGE
jgi:hypothetical protein